jgi:hypothetical protein
MNYITCKYIFYFKINFFLKHPVFVNHKPPRVTPHQPLSGKSFPMLKALPKYAPAAL